MTAKVTITHHWSVHVPKGSFLTVQNFPLNFVSFLIHSEEQKVSSELFLQSTCSFFQHTHGAFSPSRV